MRRGAAAAVVLIILTILGVVSMAATVGGPCLLCSYAMFLPVAIGAWFFGFKGGASAGIAVGLALGPLLYSALLTHGEVAQIAGWFFRWGSVTMMGVAGGYLLDVVDERTAQVRFLNTTDRYTGAPNRLSLLQALTDILHGRGPGARVSVLVVGIDNYLEIVDAFGYNAGDTVVATTVRRLQRILPSEASVGLLHACQLGIVLPDLTGTATTFAEELKNQLGESVAYQEVELYVDITIGFAAAPLHGAQADEIIQKAHVAVRTAQRTGRSFASYNPQDDLDTAENLVLLGELPRALREDQLELYYQPLLDLRQGRIVGAEALIRWPHQEHGMISPGRFIPQAENTGLVRYLTSWVLDNALAQAVEWRKIDPEFCVGVNFSARAFNSKNIADEILTRLEDYDLEPEALVVELTETAIMVDLVQGEAVLRKLTDAGVQIAIDDFGTGQSSLQYLKNLPFNHLKIDQSYLQSVAKNHMVRDLVRRVADLAAGFKVSITVEGVEDDSLLPLLLAAGVRYAQGFALGKPAPSQQFERLLQRSRVEHV